MCALVKQSVLLPHRAYGRRQRKYLNGVWRVSFKPLKNFLKLNKILVFIVCHIQKKNTAF